MDIEKAKQYLKLCNAADEGFHKKRGWNSQLWHGLAHDLCGNCCFECTSTMVLIKMFPELTHYEEIATEEEYKTFDISKEKAKEYSDQIDLIN